MVAIAGILGLSRAHSATPEAWATHEREVVVACAAVSNLRNPIAGGTLVDFDDRVEFTAVIIDGYYPQPHMENKRGRVLRLFDKRTRTASVSAADLIVRRRQP
jgi:hypothetical protein